MMPTILVATWHNGVFAFNGETDKQELAAHSVRALARDAHGRALAIVDGYSLCRREHNGDWSTIATSKYPLACCVAVGERMYVGTDDLRVLHVSATGEIEQLNSMDAVPGRDTWYAGSAIIDGQRVGPPLGIRSITATSDGAVLLANVHVGGIPQSTDGGTTWHATINVDSDVHEVVAHTVYASIVIAAAAIGLCISRDGGATWAVETEGLHAPYCSAVAFSENDILLSASAHHFATTGAVYRRPINGHGPFMPVGAGLPRWLDGIVDTACIDTCGATLAVADAGGNLYVSLNAGGTWTRRATGLSAPSSVLIL